MSNAGRGVTRRGEPVDVAGALKYAVVTGVLFAAVALGSIALGLNRDTSIITPAVMWLIMQLERWWRRRRQSRLER